MCRSSLHPLLEALPKCEHHVHIEGTLDPPLLFAIAARNGVHLPSDDEAFKSEAALSERYKSFSSLDDFLKYYYVAMSVLITSVDFEDLAWSYFQKAHADGVVHAEIFFDPQAHTLRGVTYETVVGGLLAARARAEKELGMSTFYICCFLRHLPVESALEMFRSDEMQFTLATGAIKGIGLDSSEKDFPPELFKSVYEEASSRGLKATAHAGEEGPARNVRTAIFDLHCQRIDHGIRLADDDSLMQKVAEKGTLLTVCPLSNVRLKCVASTKDVPIRRFLDAGVNFSINSDDPAYFGGYILDNYCAVQEAHDLSVDDWRRICHQAINGSWCDDRRKLSLSQTLDEVLAPWLNSLI